MGATPFSGFLKPTLLTRVTLDAFSTCHRGHEENGSHGKAAKRRIVSVSLPCSLTCLAVRFFFFFFFCRVSRYERCGIPGLLLVSDNGGGRETRPSFRLTGFVN